MAEEQETLTMQLEQTGHVLDEANAEIREKEEEIERLRIAVGGKDDEIELLKQECECETSLLSTYLLLFFMHCVLYHYVQCLKQ